MVKPLAAAVLLALTLAPVDLDVGVPPGTPLEWNREFRKPVPTGHRGGVPSTDEKGGTPGSTTVEDRTRNLDFVVANLYDYFKVTTVDIMTHVSINLPKSTGKVTQDEVATGGGFVMVWNYPPEMPVELVWMAAMSCIREEVHPEVVSWPESAIYCLELGEPSLYGAKATQGRISQYVARLLRPMPPQPPTLPKARDLKSAMLQRLAAIELTGGFPHALDPTFARRTLALGLDAYFAVLECTKNPHSFLARNAVSVLSHFPRAEVADELKKLWKETKDPVIRVRALLGLARRGEKSIVPDLIKDLDAPDEPMRCLAAHALGLIGDPAAAKPIADRMRAAGIKDTDFLWSAIPALGRLGAGKEALLDIEALLSRKIGGDDKVKIQGDLNTPTAEESGARFKVLRQLAAVALGRCGEKKFRDEMVRRVDRDGADGWHRAAHYLLVEGLARDDEGIRLLKERFVEKAGADDIVRLEALRSLALAKRLDGGYLRERARSETAPASLRALAIQLLPDLDEAMAKEVCAQIVSKFAGGAGEIPPQDGFVLSVAAQTGGKVGALKTADLVKAVERAYAAKAYARREGENETDITKAKVSIFPALLETLVIELGRTGSTDGREILTSVLTRSKTPQGRAEAALALGAIPGKDVDDVLLGALDDKDGWVRFCAARALAKRSEIDPTCDWIFGDAEHRRKPAEAFRTWAKSK